MKRARKPIVTRRTAERLVRAAYDYEEIASRLRAAGHDDIASAVRAASVTLGDCGRTLRDKLSMMEVR